MAIEHTGYHLRGKRPTPARRIPVNFLAHSVLAFDDAALLAGQIAGDFVRGRDLSRFPPGVAAGIRLHRRVDAFTDAHPAVVAARARFDPALRRHAGIVIDVVFDHLLACDWPRPAGRSLPGHAAWVDAALSVHAEALPETLGGVAGSLRDRRVLERNADGAAVAATLRRLSRRSARMAPLALAAERVERIADELRVPFATLWPDVVRMARAEAGAAATGGATRVALPGSAPRTASGTSSAAASGAASGAAAEAARGVARGSVTGTVDGFGR